jgi:hypothetical protein
MSGARILETSISPDCLKLDVWGYTPTFRKALVNVGLGVRGQCTIGTNSDNTLTVKSTATFQQPPIMSGASIQANTIPTSAIAGGGGVVLSSSDQTARTSAQIGY